MYQFRKLIFSLLLFLPVLSFSQTYTSGKKNIGLGAGYGYSFLNTHPWAYTGQNPGHTFSFRVARKTASYFYPSVNYYFNKRSYQFNSGDSIQSTLKLDHHTVSPSLGMQIPLFTFYIGKSNKYECTNFNTYFNGGIEYMINFGYNGDGTAVMKNNAAFQYGLGFIISKAGGSKSIQGRDVFINIFNKRLLKENFVLSPGEVKLYDSFFGVELLFIWNKTFKFSNM